MTDAQRAYNLLSDKRWRLNNLYRIRDKHGQEVPFRLNAAQEDLFDNLHYLNLILKARQLGFSTFIQIDMLDECLFTSNTAAATVAHTQHDAAELFDNKIKFAYDRLDPGLKAEIPAKQDSARKLSFANGSSISVGTSLRSGTFQLLHVSEYGKMCAQTPEKAKEVRTGALNTVAAGNIIWIESTAEGNEGDYHDMCQRAQELQQMGRELTPLDFKFFFYPWTWEPSYTLDAEVPIPADLRRYFDELREKGINLSAGQEAWYVKKSETQHDEMRREFPTTPDEAFEASIEGAYYAKQMLKIRAEDRICRVPVEDLPVSTFWDLGIDDETTIWLHQRLGLENRFVGYIHGSGEGAGYYGQELEDWRKKHSHGRTHALTFAGHYLPHDADKRSMGTGRRYRDHLADSNLSGPIKVVPQTNDVLGDIQTCRTVLASCWFDEEECSEGIKALDNYRREWDPNKGTFKNTPRHDWASHGADGFRTFAVGYRPMVKATRKPRKRPRV